jgi:hypothetical protein
MVPPFVLTEHLPGIQNSNNGRAVKFPLRTHDAAVGWVMGKPLDVWIGDSAQKLNVKARVWKYRTVHFLILVVDSAVFLGV